ncbi:MAG: EAL domain-containing protein [Nitrospinae bacterium]|nr:EAL domain-containing protein [Nitrospinota bacterium]
MSRIDPPEMDRLRERARKLLAGKQQDTPAFNASHPDHLIEDLRIHQIELELQNDELRRAYHELEASRNRFSRLYHESPVGYLSLDGAGIIYDVNETMLRMLGQPRIRVERKPLSSFVEKGDRERFFAEYPLFHRDPGSKKVELRLLAGKGGSFMARLEGLKSFPGTAAGDDGDKGDLRVSVSDITERHAAETQWRLADTVLQHTPQGVVITDKDQRILHANPAFTKTTGYALDEVRGQRPSMFKSGRHDGEFYRRMWQELSSSGSWSGEIWNRRKNGEIFPEWLVINAIYDRFGLVSHYAAIFSDLSAHDSFRKRVQHLAFHDALTNLPNRELFHDRLSNALARARREGGKVGVMFVDLDRFKAINDTLGHASGDDLLRQVSARLQENVRETDTVARLGGDEFVVLLPKLVRVAEAARVAEKLCAAFNVPIRAGDKELFVTVSIGACLYPDDGQEGELLLKHADLAMYQAKSEGRNCFRFYREDLRAVNKSHLSLETHLRLALNNDELFVEYQPFFDARGGGITGVEALARWRLGERMVAPGVFIPLAENAGLIERLGERILCKALRQAAQWRAQGFADLRVAVNVSARQIRNGRFYADIQRALDEAGAKPCHLIIELTESALMAEPKAAAQMMETLAAEGVDFAIDDFGIGYSSMSYLKQFRLNHLKIDRAFVADAAHDQRSAAISKAIIALAHGLGLRAIAEGVETAQQHEFFSGIGCDLFQGFFFSRPVSAEQITALLRSRSGG